MPRKLINKLLASIAMRGLVSEEDKASITCLIQTHFLHPDNRVAFITRKVEPVKTRRRFIGATWYTVQIKLMDRGASILSLHPLL